MPMKASVFTKCHSGFKSKWTIVLFALFLVGCQGKPRYGTEPEVDRQQEMEQNITEITLIAFGDNLLHSAVMKAGEKEDGGYDFTYMYEPIESELSDADIKLINQETVLVEDAGEYSDYPTFGSPLQAGRALAEVGFNGITLATNHAYDKGEVGIENTLDLFAQYSEVTTTGMYATKEARNQIPIIEKEGIRVALLNYTYGLNGIKLPEDKSYMIATLDDRERIARDIEMAEQQSDFVVVLPHWGREYVADPTEEQRDLAQFFADCGADCIIGTHPHVLEPMEMVTGKDGRYVPCYYSLGNCISSQTKVERMLGGMARVTIRKTEEGVSVTEAQLEPTVTHISAGCQEYKVYMLEDYTEELAEKHFLSERDKTMSISGLWTLCYDMITGDKNIFWREDER